MRNNKNERQRDSEDNGERETRRERQRHTDP